MAYEEALERTDTEWGPWTIVEATDRRYTWVKIYQTIIDTLAERLAIKFELLPVVEAEQPSAVDEADLAIEDLTTGEDSDDENPLGIEPL